MLNADPLSLKTLLFLKKKKQQQQRASRLSRQAAACSEVYCQFKSFFIYIQVHVTFSF